MTLTVLGLYKKIIRPIERKKMITRVRHRKESIIKFISALRAVITLYRILHLVVGGVTQNVKIECQDTPSNNGISYIQKYGSQEKRLSCPLYIERVLCNLIRRCYGTDHQHNSATLLFAASIQRKERTLSRHKSCL